MEDKKAVWLHHISRKIYLFFLQNSFLAILTLISRKLVQRRGIGEKCGFFATRRPSPKGQEVIICVETQYRKWSPTVNDPETANDPQNGPQMILDRKWSLKSTTNDPVKTWGMEWILWEWLQKRTDYKKETFFSRLLKKKGGRTLHLRSIYTRRKKKWNKSEKVWY